MSGTIPNTLNDKTAKEIDEEIYEILKLFDINSFNIPSQRSNIIIEEIQEKSIKNPVEETNTKKKMCCDICKKKISLVDDLISTCKCGRKHCPKHRMPESHNCDKMKEIIAEKIKFLEEKIL
jgi:hypothetical protein